MSNKIIEGMSPAEELLLGWVTTPKEEPAAPKKSPAKKKASGSKPKPPKQTEKETRTRRVQLVLTPTLYDQLNEAAWNNRQSVNETIIQAVTEYLKRR